MSKTRPPYPAAFREQMVELVRSGRTPGDLARECGFRGKPITDSGRNRSLIPIQTDHRFRSKPITFSRG